MCEGGGVLTALALLGLALGLTGIILGSVALKQIKIESEVNQNWRKENSPTVVPIDSAPNISDTSKTFYDILSRGTLKCGVPDAMDGFAVMKDGVTIGFDADLCRAIAAAIFGKSDQRLEFIPIASGTDRWKYLLNGDVDVLARVTTVTMERDVNEPTVGAGFEFTSPYLYNGLGFGGIPSYIDCAESGNITGGCSDLLVCVAQGTTHVTIVRSMFPSSNILPVASTADLYVKLKSRTCNVIAEEQTGISLKLVRKEGYEGNYTVGTKQYSKEPLAVVTREGDPFWSDFVFWVIESLIEAEETEINRATASKFIAPSYFGDDYKQMYQNAIAEVGNYGEIYQRHLEEFTPRSNLNTINLGNSGIMYSYPFGSLLTVGKSLSPTGTIAAIRNRGHLKCGISSTPGFGDFNKTTRDWIGFDVDYCRALTAALFDGVDTHVVYVVLSAASRFNALVSGQVDCLSRVTTFTQERDRVEPTTGAGLSFSPVVFYDGLAFAGIPPYDQCADEIDYTSTECKDLKICVQDGTTTIDIVLKLFPESIVVPLATSEETFEALGDQCYAIGSDSASLKAPLEFTGDYEIASGRHSKEPLTIVTREDDPQWTNFVRWIVFATIYAEEQGITQVTASEMPRTELFGSSLRNMLIDAINAVGNYGEIYKRSVEILVPRKNGLNSLNSDPVGPQQYSSVF
jgi:general L-amino acid transport system substrate-binding protein